MQAHLAEVRTLGTSVRGRSPLPTVFIVDDDESARASLERVLQNAGWQVQSFSSASEFLRRLPDGTPGCVIADRDGLALQQALADRPELPMIFVTQHRDIATTVRAMKAGAVDFLTKPCNEEALWRAVESAVEQSRQILARDAVLNGLKGRYTSLSSRERDVLGLVIAGKLNKQVGAELGISEITVKAHRGKMMRKMAADSLADLVNMALTLGLEIGPGRRVQERSAA